MPPSPRRRPAAPALARALKVADPERFLDQLAALDTNHNGVPYRERPDLLGMLGGLRELYLDVKHNGIWKFLDQDEGAGFAQALAWCRRIGARRAANYLRAVAKLFPDGRVPEDPRARSAVVAEIWRDVTPADPDDALRLLDRKYAGAVEEIPERLRAYVAEHREKFKAALAAPAQRGEGTPGSWVEAAPSALAALEAMAARTEDAGRARRFLAEQRGIRTPLTGKADPRMTAFTRAVVKLTPAQWRTVCERRLAHPRALADAFDYADTVSSELSLGRVIPGPTFERGVFNPAMRARDRALPAARALEGEVQLKSKAGEPVTLALRDLAQRAVIETCIGLMVHDWLVVTEEGARAARTLYAPFAGLAPLPGQDGIEW